MRNTRNYWLTKMIKMGRPELKILDHEEIRAIHLASLKILEQVGVVIPAEEGLGIFERAGADVDHEKCLVKIPPSLVEECLKKAPSKADLYARDPKYNMTLENKKVFFHYLGSSIYILDMKTGQRRLITNQDLINLTRVFDASQNLMSRSIEVDAPHGLGTPHAWLTALKYTVKHVHCCVTSPAQVKEAIRVGSTIAGDETALRKKPIMSFYVNPVSPLEYGKQTVLALLQVAEQGMPILHSSGPQTGLTGPVTLAGTLALANAENLCALTLTQLTNPGNPFIYESYARIFDMKACQISMGGPEWALFRACIAQLAQYYHLPSGGGGMMGDSKVPDMQAGYEKAIPALMAALSGLNLIDGGPLDSASVECLENIVLEDEIAGMILRILRSFETSDETLAVDVINDVGPGGLFIATKHTLKHYKTEDWMPKVTERRTWSKWMKDGGKDACQRATETVTEILKSDQSEKLPKDILKEIDRIVEDLDHSKPS